MGGRLRRAFAVAAGVVLVIASLLTTVSCGNPLTWVLKGLSKLDMVWVDGGILTLGDTFGSLRDEEQPSHQVQLSSFLMSRFEVTQALFEQVMGYNPSWFSPDGDPDIDRPYDPDLPVERVTWLEAAQFCNLLSEKLGYTPCYTLDLSTPGLETVECDFLADGFRLPTEAEWEYAARGGPYHLGTFFAGSDTLNEVAWSGDNSGDVTHPVGQLASNELGLYDMSGNVWEYVWDVWEPAGDYSYFVGYPYWSIEPYVNPHGPLDTQSFMLDTYMVLRGGGFVPYGFGAGDYERVAARAWIYNAGSAADDPYWAYDTGFRVVRSQ